MNQTKNALRINISHEQQIRAPAREIFPLACPVRELEWIGGWKYELIYSDSGFNEDNCIFSEEMSFPVLFEKPGTTLWHTTLYDPGSCRVEFLLVCETLALIKWEIGISAQGENASLVSWKLTLTSLSPEIDGIGRKMISERMKGIAVFLGQALKNYCETGKML